MKHSLVPCVLAGLVLLLAACQSPSPHLSYAGVSTISGVEYDLELSFDRHGDRLVGEYLVDAARGSFHGTVDGEAVEAELKPSSACGYSLTGVQPSVY
ncbi:MAG TPA: hypothetical protein VFD39_00555 [Trueperaceae bacterium]|nr:hypothetical protein [Trueperaceae bacterium]